MQHQVSYIHVSYPPLVGRVGVLIWAVEEGGELGNTALIFQTATSPQQTQIRATESSSRDAPRTWKRNSLPAVAPGTCVTGGQLWLSGVWSLVAREAMWGRGQWAPRFVYWPARIGAMFLAPPCQG